VRPFIGTLVRRLLAEPRARTCHDLDSPEATVLHREMIRSKPSLRMIYDDFADLLRDVLGRSPRGPVVEIGSGSGLLKEQIAGVITSEMCGFPWIDVVCDARRLPFRSGSVSVFYLQGVFHHIQDVERFLDEVDRCLQPGGRLFMIEPHNTPWSSFLLRHFHHEPFDPSATWALEDGGRLSQANQALPWIVFFRDRARFEGRFPRLRIVRRDPYGPFQYALSGGLAVRQLVPTVGWPLVRVAERLCRPLLSVLGYFLLIELLKTEAGASSRDLG
jgi:SAM-dependent methyltransferase